MQDDFSREMNAMANEILALKQFKAKTASQLTTVETSLTLNFNLELLDRWGYTEVRSDKYAIIEISPNSTNVPLASLYFDVTDFKGRSPVVDKRVDNSTGAVQYLVHIYDFDLSANNDLSTLEGGGSVALSYNTVLTTTDSVEVTVSYEDLYEEYE